ncbi:hypothetical protein TUBRATIS_009240 [Tubulinosema ratisbonensis]|uniref:Uncharacterized protein n=1 Tax=Tubulinosema ratisbonensis TaxID=291195 RepID=A0A437AN04_9MICR|nr:hypothetical protein TUBRATIS_009240 [Tubulinosema ratisbonensis]
MLFDFIFSSSFIRILMMSQQVNSSPQYTSTSYKQGFSVGNKPNKASHSTLMVEIENFLKEYKIIFSKLTDKKEFEEFKIDLVNRMTSNGKYKEFSNLGIQLAEKTKEIAEHFQNKIVEYEKIFDTAKLLDVTSQEDCFKILKGIFNLVEVPIRVNYALEKLRNKLSSSLIKKLKMLQNQDFRKELHDTLCSGLNYFILNMEMFLFYLQKYQNIKGSLQSLKE